MKAKNKHYTVKEINTISYPGKEGLFYMGITAINEMSGKESNIYLQFPFAEFYGWINESKLIELKKEYSQKFLGLAPIYDCEICEGEGFILSNDINGKDQVQKCDECNIFKTDTEAQQHVKDYH